MSQNPKYQIFISSTYEDLKSERDQVVKAVLEMGHIPVGMEMFSAADEEQWSIIKRHIESSDYYVVIVAHRYGSMVDGVSYTEKEYDHAVASKVPVLGFIIHDDASWPETKRDKDPAVDEKTLKLKAFKQKVRGKPVDFWMTSDDLHAKVAIALMKTMTAQPRVGWIPASQAASAEAAAELARLSKENADLRAALDAARRSTHLAADFEKIEGVLAGRHLDGLFGGLPIPADMPKLTLLEVFDLIGDNLVSGSYDDNAAMTLEQSFAASRKPANVGSLNRSVFRKSMNELVLEELVTHSKETVHSGAKAHTRDRWTLTERGRAFLKNRRARGNLLPTKGSDD